MTRVVASIEARMGSSRLPGKVLSDVGGAPALTRLVQRLRRCERLDGIVVATSGAPGDDAIERWARAEGVACFRGSEDDVLARVVGAQRSQGSDVVVEITGDSVLTDPQVVDLGVETFLGNDCDVVANVREPSFPQGADVQVFRLADLEEVERTVADPAVREHVSLHFYEHPELYRTIHLYAPARWRGPDVRLQLDYPDDLRFVDELWSRLAPVHGEAFGLDEIMELLRREPALLELNAHCVEKAAR